jgi:hypothetical protein
VNYAGVVERDDAVHGGFDQLAIPLFAFPQAPLRLMLVERDFYLRGDVTLVEGLENVPERLRCCCAPESSHV